ncbi:hypothetical protein DIZ81_05090 [Legionella taurinensis]|uniref:Uncharacterized protein n=1 Tax=Legionella taurinensis TaxID=70611 RepID=A0AB38N9S5_9GAMM|nr:hypothetical protein DB744_05090 [Legionella taurinensis]PUT42693.1 hypothetical protein DB746_07425 [Legionella taurinensis]PUT46721.1 hypothetical protein DB743_04825 [Legionella taurinensis]PUT47370.1 hypothetical protein DB745_08505 [Legionella taurinensis]TID36874.1 hypothetical protein DIZ41_04825 [Legionella taurinensis]
MKPTNEICQSSIDIISINHLAWIAITPGNVFQCLFGYFSDGFFLLMTIFHDKPHNADTIQL